MPEYSQNHNRKELENVLRESQEKLSLAADAAGIGFWSRNLHSGESFYDKQWLKLIGFQPNDPEITPTFWKDRIHPDDVAKVNEAIENHLNDITPEYKSKHRLLSKDGSYIWIMDTGRVTGRDNKNRPVQISGVSIDITENIRTQQRFAELEKKYKSVFDNLNDGFCRFTFNGKVLEVNRNLCDLLDIRTHDMPNLNVKLFFNNKSLKYLHRSLSKLLENQTLTFETELITLRRKVVPVSISARLITSEGEGEIHALMRNIAERKNYEKALLDEKQKFKALLEHSPNIIMRFGRNLKCQYASPNMLKIMGIPSQRCIGKRIDEIFFPESLVAFLEEKMKWVIRKNKEVSVNFSFELPYELKHFEAVMVPETITTNVVDSILLTTADVTEKVNQERELKYSKRQLEEAEKNVHFGIFEIDAVSNKILWSNETNTILERDPNLPALSLSEYFHTYVYPDDVKFVKKNFLEIKELSTFTFTHRINTQSGKTKFITNTVTVEKNAAGEITRLYGTIMDVTEKKQIEDRLFAERDLLQIILDNLPDAIYIKDNQGHYIRANKSLARLTGFDDPAEMIGKSVYDHFPKEIADDFYHAELSILQSGFPVLYREKEVPTVNGNIWLSTTIVGVKDSTGQVKQLVGISRDITQYKLSEEQLRRAKEKAEQADKLKSAFLANMSHEIRTPINGILGFANLMEMREFNREKEIQYLQIINNSGKLLLNLINDIIDIAKIEAGEINLEPSQINLNELFRDLNDFYQGEKNRRSKNHIDIKIQIPSDDIQPALVTDPFRLRQILTNLINNSLKFTDKGYIEFGYLSEKNHILFFVKDTGIGMSKEDSSVIFERFKQAGSSSKKKEGTGLGLAISKGLVEILGGKIWLNSCPGVGSEFYFTLPGLNLEQIDENSSKWGKPEQKVYNWDQKTLLLVEDEEINYIYINELLENTGINLIRVATAEEAIQICSSSAVIDLIMMDMRLPGINGFDATRMIKKINNRIPIIAQTAYAMENERKLCLEAGCDYYMTKPFDQETLFDVMNIFLI